VFCFDISNWNWFVQAHIFEIDFTAITTDSKMEDETDDKPVSLLFKIIHVLCSKTGNTFQKLQYN
jgi:hypothetical protein